MTLGYARSVQIAMPQAAELRGARLVVLATLAAIGGALLAVIAAGYWNSPNDNFAYWIAGWRLGAGNPIYTTGDAAFAPYAYHYTPPLAQLLAPLAVILAPTAYVIGMRALELLATWYLAGRRMLWMLALIAFLPVALDLRFENIHLFIALFLVLGLASAPWIFALGAIVQISPGLGILYLAARGRWRDAAIAAAVGLAIVAVSFIASPDLWREWLTAVTARGSEIGNSLVPLPYAVRAVLGAVLALVAGRLSARNGEIALVVAVTLAMPGLAINGFATLAAILPIWLAGPGGIEGRRAPVALTS